MSDSQDGATKQRNIRNHIFILNSIINEVKVDNKSCIDLQIYDIRKCFDELNLKECTNDIFEVGVTNDKLNLIYEGNKNSNMAINVPSIGLTERTNINRKVIQGGPLGPTICAVHMDKIGKEMATRNAFSYKYKGINIPALIMMDDILAITECGSSSVETNAFLNAQIELKNLNLNKAKCHQIHIGKVNQYCPDLKAHDKKELL